MKAIVHVGLKPGVLDPQGKAVADSLGRMGFGEVAGARIEKLLANTVIESYRIELTS